MNIKSLFLALLMSLTSAAEAVTSKQVFSGSSDWVTLNGIPVRKGTINATMINILELDKLFSQSGSEAEIKNTIEDQKIISQGLHATGFFDMQPTPIFLKDPTLQGRIMIAVLMLQVVPELVTPNIRNRLIELNKTAHPLLKAEINVVLKTS